MLERKYIALIIAALVILSGFSAYYYLSGSNTEKKTYHFSFEEDFEGWESKGTDLRIGDSKIDWSVERRDNLSEDGDHSVRLFLSNRNDAGKIWIQRSFDVEPSEEYTVDLNYSFGTSDYGSINLWTIIAGADGNEPESAEDLKFQGDTGTDTEEDVGYRWLDKEYSFEVKSNSDGKLYVYIGVWGTWETPRAYYVDDVRIEIG